MIWIFKNQSAFCHYQKISWYDFEIRIALTEDQWPVTICVADAILCFYTFLSELYTDKTNILWFFEELTVKCDQVYVLISNWNKQEQSVTCTMICLPQLWDRRFHEKNCSMNLTQSIWPLFRNCRKWNEKWDKEDLPAFHMATVAKETAFLAPTCPV